MGRLSFWLTAAFTVAVFARPNEIYYDLNITGLQKGLGIAALIACLFSIRGKLSGIFHQRILAFTAIYFSAILISIPFGLWPGGSIEFLTQSLLKQAAILFALALTLNEERQLTNIMKLIVYATAVVAAHTIYMYATGTHLTEGYRASLDKGIFSDPNDLALHIVFSIPIAYFILYRTARRKWLPMMILAVLFVALIVTFSRGGMIGLCSLMAAIWYFDREHRKRSTALIAAGFLIIVLWFPAPIDRLSTIVEYDSNPEASMMLRWNIWKGGIQFFADNPLTGVGLRCFSIAESNLHGGSGAWMDAHNSFVQIAAETGVFGLIGFMGCLCLIIRSRPVDVMRHRHQYLLQSAIRASAIGFMVCGTFLSQVYSWYFFYLLGFTFAFNSLAESGRPEKESRPKMSDSESPPDDRFNLPEIKAIVDGPT